MTRQATISRLTRLNELNDNTEEYLSCWTMADLRAELKAARKNCLLCHTDVEETQADGTWDGQTFEEWALEAQVLNAVIVARRDYGITSL